MWKAQQQELTERRQDKIKKEGVIKFKKETGAIVVE